MALATETYNDFIEEILRPNILSDLKYPGRYDKLSIHIYRDSTSEEPSEELEIDTAYPFYTVADLSTMIYIAMEEKEEFHPKNQCLLFKNSETDMNFFHLQYLFGNTSIEIDSPFTRVMSGKANPIFADVEGNPLIQKITSREFMLLDEVLNDDSIHLFLYSDILLAYPGIRPINRIDWEGMFRVYFPEYDKQYEDGRLSEDTMSYVPTRVERFKQRQHSIEKLDQLLIEGAPLRKPGESSRGDSINFSNIRNLRFTWKKPRVMPKYQAFRLESIFYDMPVSVIVPYIRYYPIASTPISKVHVEGPLNIPTLEDPSILRAWSQESPILPEQEFISAKVLLRKGSGSVSALYANLFIFQDGSAMFTIQPNIHSKSLTRHGDLFELVPILQSVMDSIPGLEPKLGVSSPLIKIYTPKTIQLTDAYIVLSLWLEKEDTVPITAKSLMKVLPYFRAFFQVTSSPIEEQSPIAFLRYKCVNNFRTPSRDFQFLIRISDLQKIKGATSLPSLVQLYKEEFDVSDQVAHARVSSFLSESDKYSLVDPQTLDYTQTENPGIDIAIFGKHPHYTFHIYRVDSLVTLHRIKTLLALLISVDKDVFDDSLASAKSLEQEEIEQSAEAEEEAKEELEQSPEVDDGNQGLEASVKGEMKAILTSKQSENSKESNALDFDDGLGDFGGFGDEEKEEQEQEQDQEAVGGGGGGGGGMEDEEKPESIKPQIKTASAPPAAPAAPASATKVASAAAAKAPKKTDDDDDDDVDASTIKQQPARIYFRKRLQFYDKALFSYSKTHPSLKKYPSMCAANALKQPTVLNEGDYQRMKDIYEDDVTEGRVLFIEYPVKKGSTLPTARSSKTEVITTLRYGSNLLPGEANIYICSEYWCIRDEIIILKDDFENKTVDRKGKPKDKFSCPFCRGIIIKNRDVVTANETIIYRGGKESDATKKHLFINFLTKTPHPQGLYLPCCFLKDHKIFEDTHPAYSHLKEIQKKLVPGVPQEQVVPYLSSSSAKGKESVKIMPVNYKTAISEIKTSYIVGAEKLPLELTKTGPQIGIIPKEVDAFFTQDSLGSSDTQPLVVHTHTVWKLMTDNVTGRVNAKGFFRIAAENNKRNQPDSFLAAVAPYFTLNSAGEMKTQILSLVQPITFVSLHYGNFLFDFYNPNTPNPPFPVLKDFANKRFFMPSAVGVSKESLNRVWKGFYAFEAFIKDTTAVKEYRQFAQIFSTPNLLYWTDFNNKQRMNGILFIVLEVRSDGTIEVQCPPYGVTKAQTDPKTGCDIAFILHYYSGVWEPLFYTYNDAESETFENTLVFTRDTRPEWPAIVERRVSEYERMCHSSGLGMYTDSPFVNSKTLLPISKVMQLVNPELDLNIHAIMRDSYNHVASVIFNISNEMIIIPVVDDGVIFPTTRIELDWKTISSQLATTTTVRSFYTDILSSLLDDTTRDTYEIVSVIRLDKTLPAREYAYAFQLKGGLYVPVKKSGDEENVQLESTMEGSELPWTIDRKIVFGKLEADAKLTMDFKEFEEIYQHLRYSFANWFSLSSPSLKTQINSILYLNGKPNINLPLYEKRQRLFIILGNEIESWLDSSIPVPKRNPSIKRIDCRVAGESQCKDRCIWKGEEQRCLLHIPENIDVGSKEVPAIKLLIRKLIDELIRFPEKRKELMEQKVKQYVKLFSPLRSGNQYIVPEDLPAWSELLRMSWIKKEDNRYIEEFSAISPIAEELAAEAQKAQGQEAQEEAQEEQEQEAVEAIKSSEIPVISSILGKKYYFIEEPTKTLAGILSNFGISSEELEAISQDLEKPITDMDIAEYISTTTKFSLYQLVFTQGNPIPKDPIIIKLQIKEREAESSIADFIVILYLPDGRVGLLSDTSDTTPIPYASLIKYCSFPTRQKIKAVKAIKYDSTQEASLQSSQPPLSSGTTGTATATAVTQSK